MSQAQSEESVAEIRQRLVDVRAELASLEAALIAKELKQKIDADATTSSSMSRDGILDTTSHPSSNLVDSAAKTFTLLRHQEYQRYGRQMILPQIGAPGQSNLRKSRVLIVGVGGLGCPAAAYLAGAGVGTIGLIDGDTVDTSNLHRQIIHTTDRVGLKKVDSAVSYLQSLNPLNEYKKHSEHLTQETAVTIFRQYDVVLDCTDHPTSRYLISDACVVTGLPLVSASALKTDGQLILLNNPPSSPGEVSGGPCYRCIFPKPPPAESVVSCGEGGVLGPVVGVMGVLQALETIKILTTRLDEANPVESTAPQTRMLIFSAYGDQQFRTIRMRARRPGCVACSKDAWIDEESLTHGAVDYIAFCGVSTPVEVLPPSLRTTASEFAIKRDTPGTAIIDTRDETQYGMCSLESSINIPWTGDGEPWSKIALADSRIRDAKDIFLICRHGNDSQLAANALLKHQLNNVHDVKGGFRAWRQEVDPEWPDY